MKIGVTTKTLQSVVRLTIMKQRPNGKMTDEIFIKIETIRRPSNVIEMYTQRKINGKIVNKPKTLDP